VPRRENVATPMLGDVVWEVLKIHLSGERWPPLDDTVDHPARRGLLTLVRNHVSNQLIKRYLLL